MPPSDVNLQACSDSWVPTWWGWATACTLAICLDWRDFTVKPLAVACFARRAAISIWLHNRGYKEDRPLAS